MSESAPSSQEQQVALLDLQNTLFSTQLEVQKLKRAQRQKEHQLVEAKRAAQLLETMVHEEEQQKEATWKHNQVWHTLSLEVSSVVRVKKHKCSQYSAFIHRFRLQQHGHT